MAHYTSQPDELMVAEALAYLRSNAPKKYSARSANSCVDTARGELVADVGKCLPRRQKGVAIVPVKGAYLHLEKVAKGKARIVAKRPDKAMGLTYTVPADFDWNRVAADGAYVPHEVNPDGHFGLYLSRFLPDLGVRALTQEAFASTLLPMCFEKAIVLHGDGSNGKSTALHLLKAFHPNTAALRLSQISTQFGLVQLAGATLATVSEAPTRLEAGTQDLLKALISRDPQPLERKRKDAYTFQPQATLVFAQNSFLKGTDFSYGFRRKFLILPFTVCLPENSSERILDFHLTITQNPGEMAQVLDWLLAGALRLIERGGFGEMPEAVQALSAEQSSETDTIYAFLTDRNAAVDASVKTLRPQVFAAYRAHCEEGNRKPVSGTDFWKRVRAQFPDANLGDASQIRTTNGLRERWVHLRVDGVAPHVGLAA